MLIEQIIEFELRGPVPPNPTGSLKSRYFMTIEKSPRKIFVQVTPYS